MSTSSSSDTVALKSGGGGFVIALDGSIGAGKSTLAESLVAALRALGLVVHGVVRERIDDKALAKYNENPEANGIWFQRIMMANRLEAMQKAREMVANGGYVSMRRFNKR